MRIGLVNIFSFRPHVEHLYYLSAILKSAGHDVFFMTCDAALATCYARELKGTNKITECSKCILGGIRSYAHENISRIHKGSSGIAREKLEEIALSSSCTLNRTESEAEWNDIPVLETRKRLLQPIESVHYSTKKWIDKNNLDAIICFNGRMDMVRAVTFACEELKIPYITHERTWFGDGLLLTPNNNCLSLKELDRLSEDFRDRPLTSTQSLIAGKIAAERFLQKNTLEWRLYNKNAKSVDWPSKSSGERILVLPSSKNEFAGHDDWRSGWPDNTSALDDYFERFSIKPEQVVIRCHPNWSENIGRVTGERSINHYHKWAKLRGVHLIPSNSSASTYDLIQHADTVILNGGSSAVEAGICGKNVVCLGPSTYQNAGFVKTYKNREDLYQEIADDRASCEDVLRKTLRYIYLRAKRHPQYTNYVKAIETTKYKYMEGADPERIISMISTGITTADDPAWSNDSSAEDIAIELIKSANWSELYKHNEDSMTAPELKIKRIHGMQWIDKARNLFPRGDLA